MKDKNRKINREASTQFWKHQRPPTTASQEAKPASPLLPTLGIPVWPRAGLWMGAGHPEPGLGPHLGAAAPEHSQQPHLAPALEAALARL